LDEVSEVLVVCGAETSCEVEGDDGPDEGKGGDLVIPARRV
jgi:hypothetical protein